MISIAIVEDDPKYSERLKKYIAGYAEEHGEQFRVTVFSDGIQIAEKGTDTFDIIFMDIQMEYMDGMKAAKEIRTRDSNVIIIFITNLAQYALQGYEVEALSYVLKPITYFAFSQELQRAVKRVRSKAAAKLRIPQDGGMIVLDSSRITYVEIDNHDVVYHTVIGNHTTRDSLKNIEEKLGGLNFFRCNSCYLVNLAYVEKIEKDTVVVAGDPLRISRPRRKAFLEALAAYIGGI